MAVSGEEAKLSRDAFTDRFVALAQSRLPDATVRKTAELRVTIEAAGAQGVSSYLDNAYLAYLSDPDDLEAELERHLAVLARMVGGNAGALDPARIMPCVRSDDFGVGGASATLARWPIAGDIYGYLCTETEISITYVHSDDVEDAGLSLMALRDQAIANLERAFAEPEVRDVGGVSMPTTGGNHEAGLILSAGFWRQMTARHGAELTFVVPNRDILLVTDARSPEGIEQIEHFARKLFATGTYPISPFRYRYSAGRIEPVPE